MILLTKSVDILFSTVPGWGECCLLVGGLGEPLSMVGSRKGSVRMGETHTFFLCACAI